MKTFRYKNAIINIRGEVDRKKIEEATLIFMKKVMRSRKKYDNKNTSRAV